MPNILFVNTHPDGEKGGAKHRPLHIFPKAKKQKEISLQNIAYPFLHQFYTPWPKEFSKALIGWP